LHGMAGNSRRALMSLRQMELIGMFQWKQIGLSVIKDTTYTIAFAARSDSTRTISVALMRDISPWNWYGGATNPPEPRVEDLFVECQGTRVTLRSVRLSFTVGGQAGSYWLMILAMAAVGVQGLLVDESFEAQLLRRIGLWRMCRVHFPPRQRPVLVLPHAARRLL